MYIYMLYLHPVIFAVQPLKLYGVLCAFILMCVSILSSQCILDMYYQKNKPGKVIIVYDEDERIAPNVASVFVQKDVENVFMLSGGQ